MLNAPRRQLLDSLNRALLDLEQPIPQTWQPGLRLAVCPEKLGDLCCSNLPALASQGHQSSQELAQQVLANLQPSRFFLKPSVSDKGLIGFRFSRQGLAAIVQQVLAQDTRLFREPTLTAEQWQQYKNLTLAQAQTLHREQSLIRLAKAVQCQDYLPTTEQPPGPKSSAGAGQARLPILPGCLWLLPGPKLPALCYVRQALPYYLATTKIDSIQADRVNLARLANPARRIVYTSMRLAWLAKAYRARYGPVLKQTVDYSLLSLRRERALICGMENTPWLLRDSLEKRKLNLVAHHLLRLVDIFSGYWNTVEILAANSKARPTRYALCRAFGQIVSQLRWILALQ